MRSFFIVLLLCPIPILWYSEILQKRVHFQRFSNNKSRAKEYSFLFFCTTDFWDTQTKDIEGRRRSKINIVSKLKRLWHQNLIGFFTEIVWVLRQAVVHSRTRTKSWKEDRTKKAPLLVECFHFLRLDSSYHKLFCRLKVKEPQVQAFRRHMIPKSRMACY